MSDAPWDITNTGQPYTEANFTVTEGTWMSLDISPDGETIVFDMLGDIYSIPASGGDAKLIHGGPAMEIMPRFNADGSKILYISDRGGSDNLWISNADGSQADQVSSETVAVLSAPAWKPDGKYATATRFHKGTGSEIWLYHLNGGQGRLLVEAPKNGKAVMESQFSHDGRYLYYTENILPETTFTFINAVQPAYVIKRRKLSDGKVEGVLAGFGSATSAQLSWDDKQIAFIRRVKAKTVLFVYDTRTGKQRPIYDDLDRDQHASYCFRTGVYYPRYAWFPDDRHIAIWGKGKFHKVDTQTRAVREIPFRVRAEHRLTIPPRFENQLAPESFTVRAIQKIALSPDGRNLTFNALGHLWEKALPDGKSRRLTSGSTFEFDAAYSPDGCTRAYISWDDEQGSALEILLANGQGRTLLQGVGTIRQPSFSPDGKRLVYRVEPGNPKTGGYHANAGLYWMVIADGEPHYIGPPGKHPQFSPNGDRVYYTLEIGWLASMTNTLESVNLDGLEKRIHVTSAEVTEFRVSPNLQWLAYKKDLQYYVIPYCETGSPLILTKSSDVVPTLQLTDRGGYEIVWSADSRRLNWVWGEALCSVLVDGPLSADGKPNITASNINLEAPVDKPEGIIVLKNGRIITMKDEEVIECGSVVIEGNRIAAIGPVDTVQIPQRATVIDVTGKTLMPGLIDMHGHLDDLFDDDVLTTQKNPVHHAALAFGVTTNFDPSATELLSLATGEMNLAGVTVGPRSISVGRTVFGLDWPGSFNPINDLEDARKILARKKAVGVFIIKNYCQPMRSQRQQLITAAREAQIMVTPEGEGHFYNDISMILDGHVSVEHNLPVANLYDDVIQLMAHGGTSNTPTLIVTLGDTFGENYFYQTTRPWDDPKVKIYVQKTLLSQIAPLGGGADAPPYARGMIGICQADELWDVGFRSVARSLKKLDDAGVVVNTGGHGQTYGISLHWEMWALSEGGMSNHRVLRAGTLNGAKTIGLDKQIGSLEPGKLADLLVLDTNPLDDIRNTNSVRYTMVNGRLYDSLTLNEIGNYDKPRTKFYWELEDYGGIDWNVVWGGNGAQTKASTLHCCG